jgi:DnaK suppressor protein
MIARQTESLSPIAAHARAVLSRRRRELTRLRQKTLADEEEALQTRSADWPDRAAEQETAEVLDRLSERERTELLQIDAALQRVAVGTYGRCEACGGAIGRQRLRALPQTPLCVVCETAAERR